MDMKTGEETTLLEDFECRHPRWSNDGSRILFSGYDIAGETSSDYYGGIYEIDVASKNVREIVLFSDKEYYPNKTWNQCPAEWSNDKEKIFYIDATGIRQKDLSTSQVRSLLEDNSLGSVLDISPVHDMLLFTSITNNTQNSTLKIFSPITGETIDLHTTQEGKEIGSAVWSQDGEHIFFSENKQKKSEIWCLNTSTRELRKVWSASNQNASLSIDNENKSLVASFFMQEFEVWRLKNLILANQIED
jgi:Tol biopolymer transport system component